MNPTNNFNLKEYPKGNVTQFFGENPDLYASLGLKGHNGIDLVAPWDSPLYAVEDGTIIDVKEDPLGFGRHIRLITAPRDGICNCWVYGHCEKLMVKVGEKVKAGQQIGTMGNTGFVVSDGYASAFWGPLPRGTKGTHLHLGLRKVRRTPKGWSYPGSTVKIDVQNYGNGYKGSVDPVPELERILGVKAEVSAVSFSDQLEAIKQTLLKMLKQFST